MTPNPLPIDYTPWNAWSTYWAVLVGAFVALFVPAELYALASGHNENSLSAQAWRLLDVVAGQPFWQWSLDHWLAGTGVLLLFVWLAVHFDLGWLR